MATEFWTKRSGTWRKAKEVWYKSGGTWRKAKEVWYKSGGTWRKVFSGSAPVSGFAATAWSIGVTVGSTSTIYVNFNTDGSVTFSKIGVWITDPGTGKVYYDPVTAGIGSSYWVRATLSSGVNPSTGTMGAWTQLSAAQTWSLSSGAATRTSNVLFEIADSAAGTNIVASGTINMRADKNI